MSLDTLAYIKTRSPLKVSIVFALGIILPSGILSYIGLRSYQSEQRLTQKETEERYAAVADLVQKKVTSRFSDILTPLRTLASQEGFQRLDSTHLLPILLSPPPLNGLSGYSLFVLDEADRMVAPWQEDSPPGGNAVERQDLDWGPITKDIERLERMEFVDKDFTGAIQGYNALLSRTSSPVLQAALLKNIAGDYRKLHENRVAEMTYLKMARAYDQVLDLAGYPMGVLGRQMAVKLYDEDKAWESALEIRLDLFEGLLFRRWNLSTAQRGALLKDLHSALAEGFLRHREVTEGKPRWEHLRSAEERLQTLEQLARRFAERDRGELLRRAHQRGRLDQGILLLMTSSQKMAVVVPILAPHSDRRRGYLVGILPADAIWSSINDTMAEATQASGLQVEWDRPPHSKADGPPGSVAGRPGWKGHVTRHLWKPSLQREIDIVDPPLQFSLSDASASLRDQLFKRRQWIFAGIIGLSFIVILVGMAIMAQALKREIEVANLKADFVANVSHELRTPLTVISQIGEKLTRGRYRSEDEKTEIYSLLDQQTGRLRGLVEDFLDFSKILAGKKEYQRESLELIALVQESVELFDPKAEARGFQVLTNYPPEPIPILGDARAIIQVILNLLDNAMKYSGDAREIELRVQKTATQGIVIVKDSGIGISPINQEKIFEKFYRIEDKRSARLESGVGLGLAMVKHVIEGHKGKILVQSQVGKGSTFSLIFPLAAGGIA